jgi:selenide,water dikinase|tara:strand:+ start:1669 stop:2637 length:969 start_codon:yes stop_codon:yes gene_type:complete
LGRLPTPTITDPNVLVGTETGDDAAIYRVDERVALVLTNDFFAPIVDDPFDYGQIAAANALSDVYAVGGKPITALNIAAFPRELGPDVIAKILEGGQKKAEEAGILIIGGHTVDDQEPKYGLAVTGIVTPGEQITNANAQSGDVLILTKAIGSGFITTAGKAGTAPVDSIATAVESMATLNKGAAEAMIEVGVNSATDVTGFGLLGHLSQMAKASGVSATVRWSDIPLLPGALDLARAGSVSGGTSRNMEELEGLAILEDGVSEFEFMVLADAQTSGGMLISVPEERSKELIKNLVANHTLYSEVIGSITDGGTPGIVTIEK